MDGQITSNIGAYTVSTNEDNMHKVMCPHGPRWAELGTSCSEGCSYCGGTGYTSVLYLYNYIQELNKEHAEELEDIYKNSIKNGFGIVNDQKCMLVHMDSWTKNNLYAAVPVKDPQPEH